MKTIQATVNPRLLTKANRLFTGTLEGRVIEILQNARRAGATKVEIVNGGGHVVIKDNGGGIDDFSKLLDLGGSGWEDALEQSEDPAGVGLFCLAPRRLTIRSNGHVVTIEGDGWTGAPVSVDDDVDPIQGTILYFEDEPWTSSVVDLHAVFCGMDVTVDGTACPREAFISDQAADHSELGCKIEVRECQQLNPWHHSCRRGAYRSENVLVNFHGQVVAFDHHPVGEQSLHFLVHLTGEPTGIRLMLPARTRLVENEAFNQLKAALELEAYRYLQRRGRHCLPYRDFLRAQELGIVLPEAEPTFRPGLLSGDTPEPIEVVMPDGFPLAKCYRLNPDPEQGDETDEANVHLLAALGTFAQPFIPVEIRSEYDGYSWAKLPTINKVEFAAGKVTCESWLWSGKIACVEKLQITAHASDGHAFTSPVCMGIPPYGKDDKNRFRDDTVFVTAAAQGRVAPSHIWFHLGGWNDEGDTYDSQEADFTKELDNFWLLVIGPDEQLRCRFVDATAGLKKNWKAITISPDGTVCIQFTKGKAKTIRPRAR